MEYIGHPATFGIIEIVALLIINGLSIFIIQKVSWKWLLGGAILTTLLSFIFPILKWDILLNPAILLTEIILFVLLYQQIRKFLPGWLVYLISFVLSFFFVLIVFSIINRMFYL